MDSTNQLLTRIVQETLTVIDHKIREERKYVKQYVKEKVGDEDVSDEEAAENGDSEMIPTNYPVQGAPSSSTVPQVSTQVTGGTSSLAPPPP